MTTWTYSSTASSAFSGKSRRSCDRSAKGRADVSSSYSAASDRTGELAIEKRTRDTYIGNAPVFSNLPGCISPGSSALLVVGSRRALGLVRQSVLTSAPPCCDHERQKSAMATIRISESREKEPDHHSDVMRNVIARSFAKYSFNYHIGF